MFIEYGTNIYSKIAEMKEQIFPQLINSAKKSNWLSTDSVLFCLSADYL